MFVSCSVKAAVHARTHTAVTTSTLECFQTVVSATPLLQSSHVVLFYKRYYNPFCQMYLGYGVVLNLEGKKKRKSLSQEKKSKRKEKKSAVLLLLKRSKRSALNETVTSLNLQSFLTAINKCHTGGSGERKIATSLTYESKFTEIINPHSVSFLQQTLDEHNFSLLVNILAPSQSIPKHKRSLADT